MATPGSLAPKLTSISANLEPSSSLVLLTQFSARPPSNSSRGSALRSSSARSWWAVTASTISWAAPATRTRTSKSSRLSGSVPKIRSNSA